MNNIDALSEEILKTAGLKSVGKAAYRTLGGSMIGAGIGGMKGVDANANDPNADYGTKQTNVLGGLASGALAGAAVSGPGVGAVKKLGSKALGMFKKSEILVPEDEDSKLSDAEKDVQESPNEEEIKRINNSISSEKKKQKYKDEIEKMATRYQADISCEECNYEGSPTDDGKCPNCGSFGGVAPKETPGSDRDGKLYSKDQSIGRIYDEIYTAKQDLYNAYM